MNEKWVPIPEFEKYFINKKGEVLSIKYKKSRILKLQIHTQGYSALTLRKNNKNYYFKMHRLVAITFIPNPNNYPFINHKDGNKLNNFLDNLEWCTHKMNIQHAKKLGLYKKGEAHHASKINVKDVLKIRKLAQTTKYSKIAEKFNLSERTVRGIVNLEGWKHV